MMSGDDITRKRLLNALELRLDCFIVVVVVFCLFLQLHLQFIQKINWDEFYFLSLIFDFQRGDLSRPLQTLHIHLFSWLSMLDKDEIFLIEVARLCMWLFQIGSLLLVYLTSREFCSKRSSLIGVLCFLTSGYVLIHGVSFRADPIAVFFVMICVYLLVTSRLSWASIVIMGLSMAAAVHVTIKVALFFPLLIWLAVWQIPQFSRSGEPVLRLAMSVGLFLVFFLLFYKYQLSLMPPEATSYGPSLVSSVPSTVLFDAGFLPRWFFIKEAIYVAFPQTILFIFGVVFCLLSMRCSQNNKASAFVLVGFLYPLFSLIFYRNAFPYFFPFIFLPSLCLIAYGITILEDKTMLVTFIVIVLAGNVILQYFTRIGESQESQQEVLSFLHREFPNGVNYIDRCSMLSTSKKFGFFMSSWGYSSYRRNGNPVIKSAAMKDEIPLVIANNSMLEHALKNGGSLSNGTLLYADGEYLRSNYIHHWGPVWVAGFDLELTARGTEFLNAVSGEYTVESEYPVVIDGSVVPNHSTIVLRKGLVEISSDIEQKVTLRWGRNLNRPSYSSIDTPLFTRF